MQALQFRPSYILPASMSAAEAHQFARSNGCLLFINRRGQVIAAPRHQPGWQRVGVFVREVA